ncbi:cytohesin-2 isoform X2 [Nematostella vectensis]|uniref:cytohesin-2 isoform X2 n=1 Tax=Nematostella vectensis TaxID=45351 RepID=UPI00207772A4|nr:cytohesin-2 isoform X2 [Nematostella vectensis]
MSAPLAPERFDSGVINGLTPKEQALLMSIRQKKSNLLQEIQQLKAEISEVTSELESLDHQDVTGSREDPKMKQKQIGKKKFSMDPQKGIDYLVMHGLLNNTPEDLADFLLKEEGLNKTQIGNYLGENKEFNLDVFAKFVDLHKFKDMILVQALRQFLWSFRLPGEAQKIDRMMEAFAQKYCADNPGLFTSTDTCYVLSFAIILLNTSLHNPNVKDKPTVEKFIQMNRGINCGEDLDRDFLVALYDSIKSEEFKIPEDDGSDITHTFFNPDREGQLIKEGGLHKSWRKRYFILKDNCLYYFKNAGDREPRGIILLINLFRIVSLEVSFRWRIYKLEKLMMPSESTVLRFTRVKTRLVSSRRARQTRKGKWLKDIMMFIVSVHHLKRSGKHGFNALRQA